ncbi:MAG: hypothetical protein GWM98_05200 [Nitrospinaceae bacterium]|nr:pirin family protein [Nitrospinaceae bacterium]NIR53960.1 pirin family protein [Nitrospinaceae bacterium]NIS84378.1 pirin family protein [Nitrospinaceae bacterium]NIT81180.1 pirin family protein [Nitrospinaceae bacterium]NIU43463.1 pirin family protein [Nitrospinaceae bacterium]
MITLRKSADRGRVEAGWLKARHSFSFGQYYDPAHMGFRSLRVINEDNIQPSTGFDTHPHRDMEIVTYIYRGGIRHKDSMGHEGVVRAGQVQRMSAGSGVLHSEHNASDSEPLQLLQIWIEPRDRGIPPEYEQMDLPETERLNRWKMVVSPDGRAGSMKIHQNVFLYASLMEPEKVLNHTLAEGRHAWVQVVRGSLKLNGHFLDSGDGASMAQEKEIRIAAQSPAELLLFDLE